MIPVSVVIVTKNEEKNIGDALESVKDFEDIVVVDSFSKDRTAEICRAYTGRVFQHEWQGYARQKQMAVDYAEKPWVLILDADERVAPELESEIDLKSAMRCGASDEEIVRLLRLSIEIKPEGHSINHERSFAHLKPMSKIGG